MEEPAGRPSRPIAVDPFLGTEALDAGTVTRYQLSTRYRSVHRNVYVPRDQQLDPVQRARAAWLWSRRQAVVAGVSAAALHGTLWIDRRLPAELNQASQHRTAGIVLHYNTLVPHELACLRGITVTTPARTAFDLGRRAGLTRAAVGLDALMRATRITTADVRRVAEQHHGARGIVQLRAALDLVDPGAESPQETRTRLVLVKSGLPPEHTQIDVFDRYGYHVGRVDMGWETWKVGVEYDGEQHWADPRQRSRDIDRIAELEAQGWRIIRVSAEILRTRPATIAARTYAALREAGASVRPPNLNL
ncbi:endonuclease domain-containing protein [Mycolicibacterium vaccae]|uniref:endonuclease domain-containing protein n=1 Tax=Mycolicibacterium vaccae TaxID=1810 RepID=UPI000686E7E8|nr:DUF559 domain-containing protein [Mycolicibacterium vaccae]MCV7061878.1 DUF559 domain-containing protein [Mycolicibacterium vaccae]